MLIVNTFGFEIVSTIPVFSKAVISAFNTADPVLFNTPIPLVAPIAGKFVKLSLAVWTSAADVSSKVPDELVVPTTPPICSCCLW